MKISALASGSSGNCFYIENKGRGILIDAGISAKQIVQRLGVIGRNPCKINGIFVTHEHIDHVRGIDVLSRKFNIPIYVTKKTARNCFICSDSDLINFIKNKESVKVGGMSVRAFPKSHNAADPVSYSITGGKTISVITDAGYGCKNVIENVNDSDFLCIEANHDEKMLERGSYPWHLKKLIRSDLGHLSNRQAGLCVLEHASHKLKNVMLAHLSESNNTVDLALNTFNSIIKERKNYPSVFVSLRDKPTELFRI